MKLIAEGAEAKIFSEGNKIIKIRNRKGYRIKELDQKLRLSRTRREHKILEKLQEIGVAVPKSFSVDEKKTTIKIGFIKGKKVRDVLNNSNCKGICEEIGAAVGVMHANNIMHGDLTTSNMIKNKSKVYFIDFGLGFFSDKTEDKAVDLHLLKQALSSSHNKIAEKCFAATVKGYRKTNRNYVDVLKRLEKVEARGRYKGKK